MGKLSDAHCHVAPNLDVEALASISKTRDFGCCLMSTYWKDWKLIQQAEPLRSLHKSRGVHPWYSHLYRVDKTLSKVEHYTAAILGTSGDPELFHELVDSLPDPIDLSADDLDADFEVFGEIGLDKVFRIPRSGYADYSLEETEKSLTKFKVTVDHQKKILRIFLGEAYRRKTPISVHCVKAHGTLLEEVKKVYLQDDSAICLHSYNGSISQTHQWLKQFPDSVYFSFPLVTIIDKEEAQIYKELLEVIPIDKLLVETDKDINSYESAAAHYQDLKKSAQLLAELTDTAYKEIETALEGNFTRFIGVRD